MIRSIHNHYHLGLHKEQRKMVCKTNTEPQETTSKKDEKRDVVLFSKTGVEHTQKQKEKSSSVKQGEAGEIDPVEHTVLEEESETLIESIEGEVAEETTGDLQEDVEETPGATSSSGSIGINAGKLARKLAAAKTRAQVQAVISEIQQDLKECEAGEAQGMTVDEASVQAAELLLNQAHQRMGEAVGREATPEEEMAFALAGLM